MTQKKTKTAPAAAEKKAQAKTDALTQETPSKVATDKAAAQTLAETVETAKEGTTSIETAITHANQRGATTDVDPEVVKAAEAVAGADASRAEEAIINANRVVDANTLITRRREEGVATTAENEAAKRVGDESADAASLGAGDVHTMEQILPKVEKHIASGVKGTKTIGLVEREPGLQERYVVTYNSDGTAKHELVTESDERSSATLSVPAQEVKVDK